MTDEFERELAPGMSRVKFHRVKDLSGRIVWAYQVQGVDLIRYVYCPVVDDAPRLMLCRGMSSDAFWAFSKVLKSSSERWFIPDGWAVDLPSVVVSAVDACLDDMIAEKEKTEEINQSLGFGKRENNDC
ncbi:MAG: hypothetical protein ACW99U_22175 [Candidatus Thorarchaeota archaeon]|jgi:hypothetical protein